VRRCFQPLTPNPNRATLSLIDIYLKRIDEIEAGCSLYCILLLTAIFGQEMWALKIPFVNADLRYVPFLMGSLGPVLSIVVNFIQIVKQAAANKSKIVSGITSRLL
jgi:hypothetical protein